MFGEMPWPQSLEITRRYGYTCWELAPFTLGAPPSELSQPRRREIEREIRSAGIDIIGLHWLLAKTEGYHLTTDDRETRRRTAEYLADLARLCRELGGWVMVLGSPQQRNFPPSMTHDQAEANAIEVIEQLLPTLEETQVTLALEPLGPAEGNFWNHASQAIAVIERLQSPWVKLHLDCKAMSSEDRPIADVIRSSAQHLVHFHANDPNLLGPGMGELDFLPIFAALRDIGYDRWVSVEVFDYSPGPETIARQSMECMQRCLAALK
ncbi:MAG: sugar phosphate isomerase/epimerase [Planctomycetota bacterium]|nr:MAG: sugar phosphate isomerase/epimerase [Planctomycetota bacterium]